MLSKFTRIKYMSYKAIALFSSAGIGELGLKRNGTNILVSNEIDKLRSKIHAENFKDTFHIVGDIWQKKNDIIYNTKKLLKGDSLQIIYATPPCQGMSSAGAGKIMKEVKKGNRPKLDPRNRLIIPALDIILELLPEWVILENVANMVHTVIENEDGKMVNVVDYINYRLSSHYSGKATVINCQDFDIPQNRKRLITIYSKTKRGKKYFEQHNEFFGSSDKLSDDNPLSVNTVFKGLPKLEAIRGKNERYDIHPYYGVPILKKERLWWVANTKKGQSAFSNQCVNPDCLFQGNPVHGSAYVNGVHTSNKNTPIYCVRCGHLLPRPSIYDSKTKKFRIIKGYDTTYARMDGDKPSPTLTQNFQYDSSGRHYHPTENRVLSIYEGMILQTISDYNFTYIVDGKLLRRTVMAEIIGESVPPKLIDLIQKKIIGIDAGVHC